MPAWVQPWTVLNPVAHFAAIAGNVLVKGVGLDVVSPSLLALGLIDHVTEASDLGAVRSGSPLQEHVEQGERGAHHEDDLDQGSHWRTNLGTVTGPVNVSSDG
jgi:hypothetical protein